MSLTKDEYEELRRLICPYCRSQQTVPDQTSVTRYRPETNEWVHDNIRTIPGGSSFSHTLCWASGMRTSRFNDGFEDGSPKKGG